MTSPHPIRCRCGTVRGEVEPGGTSNRIVCYCTDCRAFARFVGAEGVLDAQGGTEIIQVAQSRLSFSHGLDRLAAVRLSGRGMVRWYSACCKTPIGNTMADPKMAFVGLIHVVLDRARLDHDFGARIARVSTSTALGDAKPRQAGLLGVLVRFGRLVVSERWSGRAGRSPLFTDAGVPRVAAQVLGPREVERLKDDAGAPDSSPLP
jgi:hypothetical protein